jgi:autotransporter-associated beta strand protein
MHAPLVRIRPWIIAFTVLVWANASSVAQDKYTWNNSGSAAPATDWLTPSNWALTPPTPSSRFPGQVNGFNSGESFNADDIAFFGSTLPSNTPTAVGIRMSSAGTPAVLQLGAIWFENGSKNLLIGNSSPSGSGTLQLNGTSVSIDGIQTANVILFNSSSSQSLTIQNAVGSGSQSMGLALGVGNAVVHANSGSTIKIPIAVSETANGNGITLSGQGTLELSGMNTYSGGTTVSGGTLRTENTSGSATGSGTVTVAAGATLSGNGKIVPDTGSTAGNTVTVNGTLRPGTDSAPGTLSIGSSMTNAAVAVSDTFTWSLSSSGPSSSTPGGSDAANQSRLVVEGNLTFTPSTVNIVGLNVTDFDSTQPYSWRVATAGSVTVATSQPTFNVSGLSAPGGSFQLSGGMGAVFISYSPIPEPTSILLLCGSGVAVVHCVRCRRGILET